LKRIISNARVSAAKRTEHGIVGTEIETEKEKEIMEVITMRVLQLEESKQKGIPLRASLELEAIAELIIYNGRVIKNRYGPIYESSNKRMDET
jgi:hypothetical protein